MFKTYSWDGIAYNVYATDVWGAMIVDSEIAAWEKAGAVKLGSALNSSEALDEKLGKVAVYKTKKNAKKNKKALVKKTTTKLTFTIKSKKLKGKKTVYVRARAWNTAGFGAWSGIKKSKKK